MITNARIITGTGEIIENGAILIKENRILSVEYETFSDAGSFVKSGPLIKRLIPDLGFRVKSSN